MFFSVSLILIGFVLLIKGADFLVEGATSIARRFQVSDLVIGLTVVAFGTSSPELFVNIIASIKGTSGLAIGNILGSTSANIFLVLGSAAVIFPLQVTKGTAWKEIPFSLFAGVLLSLLATNFFFIFSQDPYLSRLDALVFIIFFIAFMLYSFSIAKKTGDNPEPVSDRVYSLSIAGLFVLTGLVGLFFGGEMIVNNSMFLAEKFGISDTVIGLTIVAVGTCLPELATSIVAALRKRADIAVGNIVGSNIFNIFFVLGVTALIRPLPFGREYLRDLIVMLAANLFLFFAMFTGQKNKIDRWEGIVFVVLYFFYIFYLVWFS